MTSTKLLPAPSTSEAPRSPPDMSRPLASTTNEPVTDALVSGGGRCSCGSLRWSWGRRRLLGAAGVNQQILAQCPTEVDKYVGVGAAVLISSTMAALSGSIAVATALAGGQPSLSMWLAALPVGVLYGAIIFAIDRFLVSAPASGIDLDRHSTKKRGRHVASSLAAVVPRLVLATVIGVLVAEPMLLVVFRSEIDQRVANLQGAEHARLADQINTDHQVDLDRINQRETELVSIDPALATARAELADIDNEISGAETDLAELQVTLRNEISGVTISETGDTATSGRAGDGPVADQIRAEIDLLNARLEGLRQRRATQQRAVDDLTAPTSGEGAGDTVAGALADLAVERRQADQQRRDDLAAIDTTTVDGLLIRIEALEWLTHHRLDNNAAGGGHDSRTSGGRGLTIVGAAVWLLRLWVLILDAIPVVFKTMMSLRNDRPYDTMVAAHAKAELAHAHRVAGTAPQQNPAPHQPADLTGPMLGLDHSYRRAGTSPKDRASSNRDLVQRLASAHPDWTQAKLAETVGLSTRQVRRYLTQPSGGHD